MFGIKLALALASELHRFFLLARLVSGRHKRLWLPLSHIGRKDVRISRGGQEIVRVTLLVSLRDDTASVAVKTAQPVPDLHHIVYIGWGLDSILTLAFCIST